MRDAMDAGALLTNGADADGEVVWSWHPDAGAKLATMLRIALATVARKPGHRGERAISRKTIARGMPGDSGVTVVTTLVCLFYFACEAAGASSARHSLRPLKSEGGNFKAKLGCIAPRECGIVPHSSLPATNAKRLRKGALATKQSIVSFFAARSCLKIEFDCHRPT